MEKLNLDAIELQQVIVTLTITGSDGSAVDLSGYRVAAAYAGCTDPYNRKPMRKSWSCEPAADGSAFVCTAPGLTLANSPWFYAIYVTQVETGLEWAVVSGRVRLVPRVAGEGGTIAPASYAVQAECSPSAVVNVALDATVGSISETLAAMQAAALAAQKAAEEAAEAASGTPSEVLTACEAQATAATQAAAAATASADRAAQQATEATNAATLAGDSADGAQASATTAADSATAAASSATEAANSATSAANSATAAQEAQTAAESARDAAQEAVATHAETAASTTVAGHVKLSTDTVQPTASAPIGVTADGQLVVPMATMTTYGSVKKSSQTGTSIPCIGINNSGQMVLNVRASHSGFERDGNTVYIQTSTDDHPTNGNEATACVATDTAGKLAVPPASSSKAGGVLLATGEDDTRATAVVTAAQFAALAARVAALENA
ncbi:MAG: hypothetical protein ACI4OZ_05260 [Akkermansia sp.]